MTSKLVPPHPESVMSIRQVTPNITTCSAPFYRFGRIKLSVKLQSGALAVFSPTALTPEVRSTVESLGNKVSYIAALDFEHHIYLGDWAKAYPNAKLMGVEGLPEKREKNPETKGNIFKYVWTNQNKDHLKVDEDFDKEFDYEYVGSHANKELVFLHKPDRTLIEADMMFNLPAYEQHSKDKENAESGILTKLFTGFQNTKGTALWQKRFLWYVASSANRPDFNTSVHKINGWNFDRIIPCHGDVIETGGKGIFQKLFAWHLQAGKKDS
ncbi:uncharacterized protein KY384_000611 [Bacidia gigantensis]|uniref:uncharacterized protein n=1 Tax=Bacidia gigantensis TaxID=2732470 RepID=UPI001D042708|nr:uncharacterized protein KY384_000611 [Bacidia gigantensis]KAG8525851.1 hypothetical protein KY384_000611 [Bacidia gigantensis]